jgi:peptidoglycan/LPS O-acetylase OafA/YrhL
MEKTTPTTRFYRPELDGLRFFAFFFVFLHHLPMAEGYYVGPWSIFVNSLEKIHLRGWMGVDLFLCLSSYLIAKLLFLEWKTTDRISVKNFFLRRIFRIWPLYFWVCLLSFLIFPLLGWIGPSWDDVGYHGLIQTYLMPYLCFIGNWVTALDGYAPVKTLTLLWTISLEEQFYVMTPFLLRLAKFEKKSIFKVFGFLLAVTIVARVAAVMAGSRYPFIWVSTLTRLDPLALGTCLALFEDDLIALTKRFPAWAFALIGLGLLEIVFMLPDMDPQTINVVWQYFILDCGFCCLIFAAIQPGTFQRFFSFCMFTQLGKISYGLYVYHVWAFSISSWVLRWMIVYFNLRLNLFIFESLEMLLGLTITIGISFVSYHLFEKQFLKLKSRFSTIQSRPV